MSNETERLAAVAAMRERMAAATRKYDWNTICENCAHTLGDHKGASFYCVTGPRHFLVIADTVYAGELIPA